MSKMRKEKAGNETDIENVPLENNENIKREVVEADFKSKLKEHMEDRLFELMNKIKYVDRENKLTVLELDDLIRGKELHNGSIQYNTEELTILFGYYREFIREINKKIKYIPTKGNFCGFIGITTSTYNEYKKSKEIGKRNIINLVDDYIVSIQLSLAQNNEINTITTIFRMKSEHGLVEATAPIVIEDRHTVSFEEIKRQTNALMTGKRKNTIELEAKDYEIKK